MTEENRNKRIYNRVIFDDLQRQSAEVQAKGNILFEDLDIEWVPHLVGFRISKYTLPFISSLCPDNLFLK
jgi:hypothetical protein